MGERQRLVAASAGCLSGVSDGPARHGGTAALDAALAANVLEPELAARLRSLSPVDGAALSFEFRKRFPKGAILDPERGHITRGESPGGERPANGIPIRQAVGEVFRQTEGPGGHPARALPGHVTVFCPRGEPEVVFFVPEGAESAELSAWRRRVEDATLAASLA